MIQRLRIYEVFEHNKAAFHDRFRDHAARIMRTYGFDEEQGIQSLAAYIAA